MPASLSRTITRLQKEGLSVADSGKTHAVKVAEALDERLAPLLQEGEVKPDLVAFQRSLARLVDHDREALVSFDGSHVEELVEDLEQRFERDTAYDELYETLEDVRSAWRGVYGELSSLSLFGRVTRLPQDPVELHRLGERIHRRLTEEDFAPPGVRLDGQSLDHGLVATALAGRVERLDQALAAVSVESKLSNETLSEKTDAIDDYQRTLRFVARCLAALYSLAGFEDLAAKVLPRRRAPRRRTTPRDGGGGTAAPAPPPDETASPEDGTDVAPSDGGPPAAGTPDADPAVPPEETGSDAPPASPTGPAGTAR